MFLDRTWYALGMADATRSFELGKPPRAIPGVTRRKLLFGGVYNQMGWFFAGFGLIFFWIFGLDSEF